MQTLFRLPAAHGLEDGIVAVLDGDIHILADFRLGCDGVYERIGNAVGVEIVQADPVKVQLAQLPQQLRQLLLFIQVDAVAGDVLGDDDALLYAAVREGLGLGEDILHPAAAVLAPQGRDNAVGAAVAAPLGNAQVGIVHGGGNDPGQLLHWAADVGKAAEFLPGGHLLHGGNNVAVAAGAHDAVHLRKLL